MPDNQHSPVNPFKKTQANIKKSLLISLIAIFFAILASIIAWFAWAEAHGTAKDTLTYAHKVQRTADQSTQDIKKKMEVLQSQVADLKNKLDELSNIDLQSQNQRALSEASYLIHLANLQLIIGRNANAALRLLEIAQTQLHQITSASVVELQQAVSKNIAALENSPQTKISILIARLQRTKESVSKLPGIPTQKWSQPNKKKSDSTQTASLSWHKKLLMSLSSLKDLVVIRRGKAPTKPLLLPEQLIFLKEAVQLKLSEAEWSVLHQNASLYLQSLQASKDLLQKYYPNQAAITDLLNEIDNLAKENITPNLPDLSDTLSILHKTRLRPQSTPIPKDYTPIPTQPGDVL